MSRRVGPSVLAALAACVPTTSYELPVPSPDVRSMLVVALPEGGQPYAAAFVDPTITRAIVVPRDGRLVVLHLAAPLAEVGLGAGDFPVCPEGTCPDFSRRLPEASRIYAAVISDGTIGTFSDSDVPHEIAGLRIPSANVTDCIAAGGCFDIDPMLPRDQWDAQLVCKQPCDVVAQPPAAGQPTLPAAPVIASLWPCPSGFASSADSTLGVDVCEPETPEPGPCPVGEIASFDTGTCEPLVGCPSDFFPDDLPAGKPAVYVRRGMVGGDGSRTAPFGSLATALAAAPAGAVVVLGQEVFEESVCFDLRDVTLWGACPARTELRTTDVSCALRTSDETRIHGVTVRGGILADGGALMLDAVHLGGAGVDSTAETLSAERLVLQDVAAGIRVRQGVADLVDVVADGCSTSCIDVPGGTLAASRLVVRRARTAIRVELGGSAGLEQIRVLDSGAEDRGAIEVLGASPGTQLALTDSHIRGSASDAIFVSEPGAQATIESTVVDGAERHGIAVVGGAAIQLRRVWIRDIAGAAVLGERAGTMIALDVVVGGGRDGRVPLDGIVAEQAALRVSRGVLHGARRHGLRLGSSDASLADLVVAGVLGPDAVGIVVDGGEVRIDRAATSSIAGPALRVTGDGEARVESVRVDASAMPSEGRDVAAVELRGTHHQVDGLAIVSPHRGVLVERGTATIDGLSIVGPARGTDTVGVEVVEGNVDGERWRLVDAGRRGLLVTGGTTTLRRVEIRGPSASAGVGIEAAIVAHAKAVVTLENTILRIQTGLAIGACDATLDADVTSLEGSEPRVARGLYLASSSAVLERFSVRSMQTGIVIDETNPPPALIDFCSAEPDSTVRATEGEIIDNAVGVEIGAPSFDLASLANRVVYRGNGVAVKLP